MYPLVSNSQYPCGFAAGTGLSALSAAVFFTVPGTPVAKGRPRSFIRNGHVGHYTPEKTVRYESLVAHEAAVAMAGGSPVEGAVRLCVMAYFPIPASWPKWRKEAALSGAEQVAKKPDIDNVVKAVKDGMNGVAWRDDCQVVSLVANKEYSDRPRVEVTFEEVK
jgi:Holliday junction resolvase RusA-like endonuclease